MNKKLVLVTLLSVFLFHGTVFADDTYLTTEECTAQGGLPENGNWCSNSDINKNVGKLPGIWGRICCVNTAPKNTTRLTKEACQAQSGTCLPRYADGRQCSAGKKPLGICTNDAIVDAPCCGEPGSDPTTATKTTEANTNTPGLTEGGLNYQLLEPIPGQEGSGSDLPRYLKALLNASLVIIVLSAVFMISVGGFMYLISAGSTAKATRAKGIITDALFGLILALVAYLLLYVINPDLVQLRLSQLSINGPESSNNTGPGGTTPSGTSPSSSTGSQDTYTNDEAVSLLNAQGISVTSTGHCSDQNNKSCTSLQGIPKSTISNIINLKEKSGCGFNVTGGTEVGHVSHASGQPIVDLSRDGCLANLFSTQKPSLSNQYNITKICATQSDQIDAFNCSYIEPESHFHVAFSL